MTGNFTKVQVYEIVISENINDHENQQTLVVDYGHPFETTYTEQINIAAALQFLVVNSIAKADNFDVYSFCGIEEHYDQDNKRCV